jgi:small-conductance mechanosensitive channel
MQSQKTHPFRRTFVNFLFWAVVAAGAFLADSQLELSVLSDKSTLTLLGLAGLVCSVLAGSRLLALITMTFFQQTGKPVVEGMMVSRLYGLLGFVIIAFMVAYGFGTLAAVGGFFAAFGGMLMGFSLQAPISGFAAWVLVSVMRPFRPGDRVQFPNLGLVGDVKDVGLMYTVLDQVGGSVGSEEPVGRNILIPNAMLFSQVAINYTVTQDSSVMLDEVVVRITFDSDWAKAEMILLGAAKEITGEIIKKTGMEPYIRSDMYDYGVYLRLRYQTAVKDRAQTAYRIGRRIFEEIQLEPNVDHAIPFLYSSRVGRGVVSRRKEATEAKATEVEKEEEQIRDIAIAQIFNAQKVKDWDIVDQLGQSIATHGLLQPIVVIKNPSGTYDVVAGQMRLEACKRLGWKTIPAVVRDVQLFHAVNK